MGPLRMTAGTVKRDNARLENAILRADPGNLNISACLFRGSYYLGDYVDTEITIII